MTVVADARLDDRPRLETQLGAADDDAELVLRAYERWGDSCAAHLTGAFAFVLFDERRGRLLAARDHMGFRPLHWWWDGTRLVIASWAENVLADPGVPRLPDRRAAAARAANCFVWLREQSPFEGVLKLAPGGQLSAEPGGAPHLSRHWEAGPRAPSGLQDAQDCIHALRETVRVAVADAVRDAEPTGAHLSGGLDSSAIAVLADQELRRLGSRLAQGYSYSPGPDTVPPLDAGDERDRIARISTSIDVPMTFLNLTPEHREHDARARAALLPSTMILLERDVLADAAGRGLQVILSGWGGDEVASFNGRGWIGGHLRAGRFDRAVKETWDLAHARAPDPLRRLKLAGELLWQDGFKSALSSRRYMALGLHRRAYARGGVRPPVETDAMVTEARVASRMSARDRPGVHASQCALLGHGHLTGRIESWAWWGDRVGVAYRYPLLDKRVVELCLALPEYLWWHGGERRWVFRRVADGILPPGVSSGAVKREGALEAAIGALDAV